MIKHLAVSFLNNYGVEINSDTKEKIIGAYAWLLWSKYKEVHIGENHTNEDIDFLDEEDETLLELDIKYDKDDLVTKIEQVILLLFNINNSFNQTLISNLFSIVLKSEKKKPAPNWRLINDFCNSINPEFLSHDCSTIQVKRKGQTKDMEKKFFSKPKSNQKGEIVKIMNDNARGKDGFLKSDNKEFYFSLSANYYLTHKIQIGTKVEFNIMLSKDEKREQTKIFQIIE